MTTDTVGGVWSYCVALIRALATHEISVTLASMGPPPSADQRASLADLRNVEQHHRETKLEWMDGGAAELAAAGEWLLKLGQRAGPDLVHLNGYAEASLAWDPPTIVVGHSCVCSWSLAVDGRPAPPRWDGYRRRVRAGLRRAAAVVAPSAWMLAQLLALYEVEFEGLVIHNGRSASDYLPGPKTALVLGAGRMWDRGKNLAALDAVARTLPWPVQVAGPIRDPKGRMVSAENLELLGPLGARELSWWMSHAAIFAHPARYEPFGLAPLEAALSGCALVLGDIPSLRELWAEAAVFVDPDDHAGLAAALTELIADPVRRNGLATRARARAAQYSVARMARAYRNLYLEVVHVKGITACAS